MRVEPGFEGWRASGRAVLCVALLGVGSLAWGQAPADLADKAEAEFTAGHITEALADYDRVNILVPSVAPFNWERGIALYELGRYRECAQQFVDYHTANPQDLESVAWHFLCTAHAESFDKARAALLPEGSDPRIMRGEVYLMLRGIRTPAELLDEADKSVAVAQFYAHLYVGLYFDAMGDRKGAIEQLTIAAGDPLREEGGFMNAVAHVELARLQK